MAMQVANAVAIVIRDERGSFLSVLRPDTDAHLPDIWGLPAINLAADETAEQAAVRAGKEKLGVEVEVTRRIGCETVARPTFALHLTEFEVRVVSGIPVVPQRDPRITQYVAAKFTDNPRSLIAGAARGSACCRIFLREAGISWQGPTDLATAA